MLTMKEILFECEGTVDQLNDSLLFYFREYPQQRQIIATALKETFSNRVDTILKEFEEEEE